MKHLPTRDENSRFKGNLRHYHRASPAETRTWDQWVGGNATTKGKPRRNRLKLIAKILAWLALAGIIVGLIVELR